MDVNPLQVQTVWYSIGNSEILRDLSAAIPNQSLTGLIGPNGAGKSTLLRLLNGLRKPSQGRILLNGRDVHSIPDRERAREIAMMPQNPGIGFGFTVGEIVAMGRHPFLSRLAPLSERCHTIVAQAMRSTRTERFAERRINELSGGERQRVFLARALAQEPRILLLDEPTANLDVRYQLEVYELITQLQREQAITVVMAVHDLTWALRYCTHLIVLQEGRLAAEGPTRAVITEELVRNVFGVRAALIEEDGHLRLDVISL